MKLRELIAGAEIESITGPASPEISAVTCDSRKAGRGSIFFALRGEKLQGIEFVNEALALGAIAVASESPRLAGLPQEVTWIELASGTQRRALARAAANFYKRPTEALKLIGITGTNGKTTTAHLVDSILHGAGLTSGFVGTTGHRTPTGQRAALNTTPESVDLQRMFAEVRDAGGTHAVLEASSHALAMDRLWGCHFAVAVFTNLTRDHLDYHKNFEEYFEAKRLLFAGTGMGSPDVAVLNADDAYSAQLHALAQRTLTYGLKGNPDVMTKKFALSSRGLEFTAQTPAGRIDVNSPLVGRFNVYNILAAIAVGIALKISPAKIEAGLSNLESVPGRFQRIDEGQPYLVVVDYAHTDDALRNLIGTARELIENGRIITLFGAGGERDRTKRPLMGEAAGALSDLVVLTSDNPRSEDPLRIINDVVVGLQKVDAKYRVEPDRERAIEMALAEAKPGDIVLLAGKGHEASQVMGDRTIEFDDREKARSILRAKGYSKKSK